MAATPTPPQVLVPVKSAWLSKINWTQLAGPIATGLAYIGLPGITQEQLLGVFAAIQTVQSIVTFVLKTWFSPTVTPASIAPASPSSLGQ